MKGFAHVAVGTGWLAFAASFFLPTIRIGDDWRAGSEMFTLGGVSLMMALAGIIGSIPAAAAFLSNIVMLFSPIAYASSPRDMTRRATPYVLAIFTPLNAIAGLVPPQFLSVTAHGWGFYLWAASFPLVALSFFLRRATIAAPQVAHGCQDV